MPFFTTSDGLSLFYDDQGSGVPILCLAGLTRNATDFDYVLPHLAGHRVIRLDYRGRGQSDWGDWQTYTIPVEARDVLELMDHLSLDKTAILGTSRGGLVAMVLAATVKHRLTGVALNDIGPDIAQAGLDVIKGYIGRDPAAKTHADAAVIMASRMEGFHDVPHTRWVEEAAKHYIATASGLTINYDPALAQSVAAAGAQPVPDLWPFFDAMAGLPLALIRGKNSNLLAPETADEMRRRRPDMVFADVPDRGHVPFLDEPAALAALEQWRATL